MKKKSSLEVAAELLSGLPKEQKEKVIGLMKEKDAELTKKISDQLFQFKNLTKMTPSMMADFLKVIPIEELGLALKIESHDVQEFFFKGLSKRLSTELKEIIEQKKVPRSKAEEAHQKVIEKARELEEKGVLVLNENGDRLV